MPSCEKCGAALSNTEIALHRKLVNRGAKTFLCYDCLGKAFKLSRRELDELAVRFKKAGCTLFF